MSHKALSTTTYRLGVVFVVFSLILGIPLAAEASFLSTLFNNAQADTVTYKDHVQNMLLPDPNNTSSATNEDTKLLLAQNTVSASEGVLDPVIGPMGTATDVDLEHDSDIISVYTVHKGDSLPKIAALFDVSVNTIRWANNLKKDYTPKEGDTLVILPIDGVSYVVKKGDTLKSIARVYGADAEEIGRYNGLELDSELAYGQTIIIPDGEVAEPKAKTPTKKPATKSKLVAGVTKLVKGWGGKDLGGYYIRPLTGGLRTQGLHGQNAVDMGAPIGTPVYAAADGVAIIARTGGYNGGYGNYVILKHPNGTQTVYGHMSKVLISQGQSVSRGEQIGAVGSTGRSTGPHLHFEVRGAKNPLGDNPRYGL